MKYQSLCSGKNMKNISKCYLLKVLPSTQSFNSTGSGKLKEMSGYMSRGKASQWYRIVRFSFHTGISVTNRHSGSVDRVSTL